MKRIPVLILFIFLLSCIIPLVSADNEAKYSYIEINDISLELSKNRAVYNINYDIDDGVQFLVAFLGKSDLKNKLCKLLNYENCRFEVVDMNHAVMVVDNPSIDNGDGSLWFPRKEIEVIVPEITVKTPRTVRSFNDTGEIPGLGYFSEVLL